MGVDAADFNNDGRTDFMVADMLPEREEILKTSANAESFNLYDMKIRAGYHPQYARNTLQLNRGFGKFSDIGYLAGVYATDWSWAPLFADLDNDGRKDLFITNGIYRRPNDLDYIDYVGNPAVQASLEKGITPENLTLLQKMPQVPLSKFAFHNNGDLTFTDMAAAWGLGQRGFSNGAVYVDLNNSGALDLVVNNVNAPASIYRNRSRELNHRGYLTVALKGSGANTLGIGAKVTIVTARERQLLEQSPTRGFQSSVDPRLHFGIDSAARIDSLIVVWPDRRYQVLTDVAPNQTLVLSQEQATGRYDYARANTPRTSMFEDVTAREGLDYVHRENVFSDYNREPLMTALLSTEGPALAVADVDGDGLDDLYAGGAKWQPGRLLIRQRDGRFHSASKAVFQADSLAEDVDAAFFDANGDGRVDLYVVSAGNEFAGRNEALRDRLYINDGAGAFHRDVSALPESFDNGSCVLPGDFDGDGDIDLFVGSRVVPQRYGLTPTSHLLENDGTGHFSDVTAQRSEGLADAGMVTSAAWIDYDGDKHLDLVVTGEWMPVRIFHQESGHFVDRTLSAGLGGSEGWWNSITAADLNGDGRTDLVLGNLGLNSYIRASAKEPARLYVDDFTGNGSLQQILTFYKHGVSYPVAGRDELIRLIPSLRSRYPSYADFGASTLDDILPSEARARATVRTANDFATSIALNKGDGTFALRALPAEAQFAPVRASLVRDFTGDGNADLLLAGNFFGATPIRGRYDASYGTLLRGAGNGSFVTVPMEESNLVIEGQARHLREMRATNGDELIIVARNDTSLQVLRINATAHTREAALEPRASNPQRP